MTEIRRRSGPQPLAAQTCPSRARQVTCSAAVAERQSSYSGSSVSLPESGHHFLHIDDFSRDELMAMLKTSATVKQKLLERDESYKPFAGKTMSMIFTKPSMRTRLSFETVREQQLCTLYKTLHACTQSSPTPPLKVLMASDVCPGILQAGRTCNLFGT